MSEQFQLDFYQMFQYVKQLEKAVNKMDYMYIKDEVLDSRQVMDLLKISEPTLIKLESNNLIKFKRVVKQKRYLLSDIMAYMKAA